MTLSFDLPQGYRSHSLDTVDSTNDEARRLAEGGAPDRTVVIAEAQTAGHGRRGRSWVSPRGNLFCSILLRPRCPPAMLPQITFIAALATRAAIAEAGVAESALSLKWPNDVLLGGRKVAGILLEGAMAHGGHHGFVVVGIGVNLAHHPEGLEYPVTSVGAGGGSTDLGGFLSILIARFETGLRQWEREGFEPVRHAWWRHARDRSATIRVRLDGGSVEGRFAGLDRDGALLLDLADGAQRRIMAGEVISARHEPHGVG